jgi:hypothetical protein
MRRRVITVIAAAVAIGLVVTSSVYARGGQSVLLRAHLTGDQEVPPADLDARGLALVRVDAAAGEVCFDIKVNGVGTPNRGHIHVGAAGVNGGIVVPFFELRPGDAPVTDARHDALENGRLVDCVSADPAILRSIVADPDAYYVNLHNTRYPGGALRCQLER